MTKALLNVLLGEMMPGDPIRQRQFYRDQAVDASNWNLTTAKSISESCTIVPEGSTLWPGLAPDEELM